MPKAKIKNNDQMRMNIFERGFIFCCFRAFSSNYIFYFSSIVLYGIEDGFFRSLFSLFVVFIIDYSKNPRTEFYRAEKLEPREVLFKAEIL